MSRQRPGRNVRKLARFPRRRAQVAVFALLGLAATTVAHGGEIEDAMYQSIMAQVIGKRVATYTDGLPGRDLDQSSNYRTLRGTKVLAACIAWSRSTVGNAVIRQWNWSSGAGGVPTYRARALETCRSKGEQDCTCTVVDIDDRVALQVPAGFPRSAASAPAAPPSIRTVAPPGKAKPDQWFLPGWTAPIEGFSGTIALRPVVGPVSECEMVNSVKEPGKAEAVSAIGGIFRYENAGTGTIETILRLSNSDTTLEIRAPIHSDGQIGSLRIVVEGKPLNASDAADIDFAKTFFPIDRPFYHRKMQHSESLLDTKAYQDALRTAASRASGRNAMQSILSAIADGISIASTKLSGISSFERRSVVVFDTEARFGIALDRVDYTGTMHQRFVYDLETALPLGMRQITEVSEPGGRAFRETSTTSCRLTRLSDIQTTLPPASTVPPPSVPRTIRERLEALDDLLKRGLITEPEARHRRQEILKEL